MWPAQSLDLSAADFFLGGGVCTLTKEHFLVVLTLMKEKTPVSHAEIRGILEEMFRTYGRLDFYKTLNPNVCTFN